MSPFTELPHRYASGILAAAALAVFRLLKIELNRGLARDRQLQPVPPAAAPAAPSPGPVGV